MNTPTTELDGFESLLRERLHVLADHAPTRVPAIGDVNVIPIGSGRRGRRAAGIGATIAVIAGGVGLTTMALQGAAEPGGADSPEAAVREFADALAGEDLLGMIDVALPEEVTALRAAFEEAASEAQRLGLLDEAFALDGVAGVDVTVDGLALRTDSIDTDLAAVTSTDGRLGATFDAAAFPLGRLIRDADARITNGAAARDMAAEPFTLVTLRREGRWYVSLGMTIAESVRSGRGDALPDSLGLIAQGSSSPEAAAEAFYQRLADLDLAGVAALAAPGEGDVFRRYASLWLPPVEDALTGSRADGLTVSLSGLHVERVVDADGRITLAPTEFVIEGTVPASWGAQTSEGPTRTPGAPTLVDSNDGRGAWILDADAVVPATVDDLVGEPSPYESDEVLAVYDRPFNSTWVNPDGTIQPLLDVVPASMGPTPFRIERSGGCTMVMGSPFSEMVAFSSDSEQLGDGSYRACDDGDVANVASALLLVRGGGALLTLPSVAVVEDGGEWFVSPIGTIAAQILEPIRALPDDVNAIDVPLLPYALGASSRDDLDRTFQYTTDVPPACTAIVEPGGSGALRTIADPALADVRACANAMWFDNGGLGTSVEEGSETVAPPAVDVETVPVESSVATAASTPEAGADVEAPRSVEVETTEPGEPSVTTAAATPDG